MYVYIYMYHIYIYTYLLKSSWWFSIAMLNCQTFSTNPGTNVPYLNRTGTPWELIPMWRNRVMGSSHRFSWMETYALTSIIYRFLLETQPYHTISIYLCHKCSICFAKDSFCEYVVWMVDLLAIPLPMLPKLVDMAVLVHPACRWRFVNGITSVIVINMILLGVLLVLNGDYWLIYIYILVGGLEHFLFSHILGIIIPID